MIKALAKEQEVGLVDSLAEFRSYVKNGGKLADLMCHENHPNRKGHELVAKKLLEWFPEQEQSQTAQIDFWISRR